MREVKNRWNDIQRNTRLSLEQLLGALDIVLSSTSFVFDGRIYEQIYGSLMVGSPLSLLSDERFHMANLEVVKTVLLNNGYPPALLNKQIIKRHKDVIKNKMSGRYVTND